MSAKKEADVRPGKSLAVSGVGGLGYVAIQYAKAMGIHVAALDIGEDKLTLARHLGADIAIEATASDAVAQVVKATGGGVHGAIVTAVSPPAFGQALSLVRRKGTVSLVGLPPGNLPLPFSMWFLSASPSAARSSAPARIWPAAGHCPRRTHRAAARERQLPGAFPLL